jgi:UDP-N-acetylglucosamine 2-epimerase
VLPLRLRGLSDRIERAWANRRLGAQVRRVETYLHETLEDQQDGQAPVLFFNASTRIHTLSLNAAFSLLTSWGLRARGVPARYVVCHRGMEQCILGTNRLDPEMPPPCGSCTRFSGLLFPDTATVPLGLSPAAATSVGAELRGKGLEALSGWEHRDYPLGQLCLPGLQWALRRYHLPDDPATRMLFRQYLRSAASLVARFEPLFDRIKPSALVLFNGLTYPEAVAWAVARRRGIEVITHEVGLQPASAFFSHQHATFRQIDVPDDYELTTSEEESLDRYLADRRHGRFTMAGIRFWPSIGELPERVRSQLERFNRMVVVFTNVIFDTSQIHANVLFDDMFDWLDAMVPLIESQRETLFVLRAHPDENRPGKESQESVAEWYRRSGLEEAQNVLFFPPNDRVSSYQLIERANLILVYNSSIGLEAAIMGAAVLSAGRARYTQAGTVFMPATRSEYLDRARELMEADVIEVPKRHRIHARRFLYRELHHASLDFSAYLRPYPSMPGMVQFSAFEPSQLAADPLFDHLRAGIIDGETFVRPPAPVADAG